jgi:hypothetical protein
MKIDTTRSANETGWTRTTRGKADHNNQELQELPQLPRPPHLLCRPLFVLCLQQLLLLEPKRLSWLPLRRALQFTSVELNLLRPSTQRHL